MSLFEWWGGLNPWWRYGVAVAFLLLSTILLICGLVWVWGWVVGVLMLLFGGPSDSEKKGYRW